MENQVWFVHHWCVVKNEYPSGIAARADAPHTLKIHFVFMQKLHYWYKKTPTDPSALLNVKSHAQNSLLFLILD